MTYRIQFLFRLCDFLRHFRIITPQRAGCLSLFPNLEGFKVEVLLLVFWAGVTTGLGLLMFFCGQNCLYHIGNKSIPIFAFGQALLSALEIYVVCAAAASGRPSQINIFGFFKHYFSQVHVVTRSMKRTHRWVFLLGFLFGSIFC